MQARTWGVRTKARSGPGGRKELYDLGLERKARKAVMSHESDVARKNVNGTGKCLNTVKASV